MMYWIYSADDHLHGWKTALKGRSVACVSGILSVLHWALWQSPTSLVYVLHIHMSHKRLVASKMDSQPKYIPPRVSVRITRDPAHQTKPLMATLSTPKGTAGQEQPPQPHPKSQGCPQSLGRKHPFHTDCFYFSRGFSFLVFPWERGLIS